MNDVVKTEPKTQAEEPQNKSALKRLAERLNVSMSTLATTLKNTCFKPVSVGGGRFIEVTDDQFAALVIVADQYNLNPLTKELYAFPEKGGGIVPIVSIDGWLRMINSHAEFNGLEVNMDERDGKLYSATCTIWRRDRDRPTIITEYYDECVRPTEPWKTMKRRMLRHKSIIQCARVAFSFAGIYDQDEANDIISSEHGATVNVVDDDDFSRAANERIQKRAQQPAALEDNSAPDNASQVVQESANSSVKDQGEKVVAETAAAEKTESKATKEPADDQKSFAQIEAMILAAKSKDEIEMARGFITDSMPEDQAKDLNDMCDRLGKPLPKEPPKKK